MSTENTKFTLRTIAQIVLVILSLTPIFLLVVKTNDTIAPRNDVMVIPPTKFKCEVIDDQGNYKCQMEWSGK